MSHCGDEEEHGPHSRCHGTPYADPWSAPTPCSCQRPASDLSTPCHGDHVWRSAGLAVDVCTACGVTSGPATPGSAQNASQPVLDPVPAVTPDVALARSYLLAHAERTTYCHAEVARAYEALGGQYRDLREAADRLSAHPTITPSTEGDQR